MYFQSWNENTFLKKDHTFLLRGISFVSSLLPPNLDRTSSCLKERRKTLREEKEVAINVDLKVSNCLSESLWSMNWKSSVAYMKVSDCWSENLWLQIEIFLLLFWKSLFAERKAFSSDLKVSTYYSKNLRLTILKVSSDWAKSLLLLIWKSLLAEQKVSCSNVYTAMKIPLMNSFSGELRHLSPSFHIHVSVSD